MKAYREGVPEAESPCSTPELDPVGWYVEITKTADGPVGPWRFGAIVWVRYATEARELGARKLRVLDPSELEIRRLKGAA